MLLSGGPRALIAALRPRLAVSRPIRLLLLLVWALALRLLTTTLLLRLLGLWLRGATLFVVAAVAVVVALLLRLLLSRLLLLRLLLPWALLLLLLALWLLVAGTVAATKSVGDSLLDGLLYGRIECVGLVSSGLGFLAAGLQDLGTGLAFEYMKSSTRIHLLNETASRLLVKAVDTLRCRKRGKVDGAKTVCFVKQVGHVFESVVGRILGGQLGELGVEGVEVFLGDRRDERDLGLKSWENLESLADRLRRMRRGRTGFDEGGQRVTTFSKVGTCTRWQRLIWRS